MAEVIKCDRCGKVFDNYSYLVSIDNISGGISYTRSIGICKYSANYGAPPTYNSRLDLCSACQKQLREWFEGKAVNATEESEE